MAAFNFNLSSILHLANLGQSDVRETFNPVYGYQTEEPRWIQRALLFFVLCLIILTYLKIKNELSKIKFFLYGIVSLVLVFICVQQLVTNNEIIHGQAVREIYATDYQYYKKIRDQPLKPEIEALYWSIEEYNIDLQINDTIKAEVTMDLSALRAVNKLNLSLYHLLKVSRIVDEQGNELRFSQKNDRISIYFPEISKASEKKKIIIHYEGNSSPFYFANSHAVLLPYYFKWYPTLGSDPAMIITKYGNLTRIPPIKQKAKVTLAYQGRTPIFTNLTQQSSSLYISDATDGITLVSGLVEQTSMKGINVLYPVTLKHTISIFPEFIDQLKAKHDEIQLDLDLEKPFPGQVLFVSVPAEDSRTNLKSQWLNNEQLIVAVHNYSTPESILEESKDMSSITYSLIASSTVAKKPEFSELFTSAYSYWKDKDNKELDWFAEPYRQANSDKERSILSELQQHLDKKRAHSALMRSFFRTWLNELSQEYFDWNTMKEILEDYREEG